MLNQCHRYQSSNSTSYTCNYNQNITLSGGILFDFLIFLWSVELINRWSASTILSNSLWVIYMLTMCLVSVVIFEETTNQTLPMRNFSNAILYAGDGRGHSPCWLSLRFAIVSMHSSLIISCQPIEPNKTFFVEPRATSLVDTVVLRLLWWTHIQDWIHWSNRQTSNDGRKKGSSTIRPGRENTNQPGTGNHFLVRLPGGKTKGKTLLAHSQSKSVSQSSSFAETNLLSMVIWYYWPTTKFTLILWYYYTILISESMLIQQLIWDIIIGRSEMRKVKIIINLLFSIFWVQCVYHNYTETNHWRRYTIVLSLTRIYCLSPRKAGLARLCLVCGKCRFSSCCNS
jgi:hypothetical protein